MKDRVQVTLRIEGMTCDGCARHVTEALKSVAGVEEATVSNWQSGRAQAIVGPNVADRPLIDAVARAGYHALVLQRQSLQKGRRAPKAKGADFDLLILGGGSAAFAAAIKGAELGAKVAIVEKGTIGGTCVNIGCVPSKTLIRAAELCYRSAYPNFEGLAACPPPSDWARVIQQKDDLVASLREGKYVRVAESHPNISIIKGEARLAGNRQVWVNGKGYTAGKIVIATGAHPWTPPIPGLAEAGYLDSTDALSLPALPKSMIVIGGGAIGLELGQLFTRFGVRVILLESAPHIAPGEDPELGAALARYLQEEKMQIHTGASIIRVERGPDGYRVDAEVAEASRSFAAEQLLVTTGRRPTTEGFGLEEAGVQMGRRGEVLVNQHLQTSHPEIYAAGDVIGDPMFVYVAAYAGGLVAENALAGIGRVYDLSTVPRVTFTDPQIASVGLTESQAREKGLSVKTSALSLKEVPRAIAARNTRGLIKLVAEEGTGKLLGAHLLAAEGGEIIQEATLAIRFGLTKQDLIDTFHPYLTMAEGLKLAALTFDRDVKALSCCAT
ncbi:mercury(II) reductase [Candidatus Manganitrophus noduliformans]|uniref:Mercuric reductase n=1 Tax=Candidatus Manganitrophus noduliformans TaxID=2606439 RepID=A0A7X6IA85_9BACT|nr:mercury(II) reductase [Candidatus Manganitrophus noduliformans]NKE70236.1 mercury(II) reductase [Candidatus Manganitrophus noduliformans]